TSSIVVPTRTVIPTHSERQSELTSGCRPRLRSCTVPFKAVLLLAGRENFCVASSAGNARLAPLPQVDWETENCYRPENRNDQNGICYFQRSCGRLKVAPEPILRLWTWPDAVLSNV